MLNNTIDRDLVIGFVTAITLILFFMLTVITNLNEKIARTEQYVLMLKDNLQNANNTNSATSVLTKEDVENIVSKCIMEIYTGFYKGVKEGFEESLTESTIKEMASNFAKLISDEISADISDEICGKIFDKINDVRDKLCSSISEAECRCN
jgi:hypothetical protein